ncbi:MAG: hypothetical protein ABEJ93_04765 [Candidatus Nanohalobium sp.]
MFLLGVLFSTVVDGQRAGVLENELKENLVELESRNLQLNYLKSSEVQSCSVLKEGLSNTVSDYNDRLEKVKIYQEESLLRKQKFEPIKQRYVLSGIRYWIFAEDLKQKCSYNADTILFFRKSIGSDAGCEQCKRQGEQLSLLKKRYDDRILIFSVPLNMEDGMIEILEKQYNVSDVPVLVLNGNKTLHNYHSRSEIIRELNLSEE